MRALRLVTACVVLGLLPGCGPAPSDVCDHLAELTEREASPGATVRFDLEACGKSLDRVQAKLGSAAWGPKARCMLTAETLVAVDAC